MTHNFEIYKPRLIDFLGVRQFSNWKVKLYTITNNQSFQSKKNLKKTLSELPNWLLEVDSLKLQNYKVAFLIVHEAREGTWILLSWWTGGEMIQSKVYFSTQENPLQITSSPYKTNALLCVWELEVFAHERKAWIENVLDKNPNFDNYLLDHL
ncbi:hypothetical protein HME9304_01363 [Flagellimonas maritima]|uniref:Uncharacterized protein n=1 Tax=Flagellimonas maritima TaxID=1383885 RepID=A0A2Z4LRB1_9FLAO|nr:hypothetical protein [Allomuricauda aurantiaca]AWX44363.1 hypothetical protein HME9304_01363 [Allomuricauda aurantiaca]